MQGKESEVELEVPQQEDSVEPNPNRVVINADIKPFVKEYCPWFALLSQEVLWKEMQDKVDSCALLTNLVTAGGWGLGKLNLYGEFSLRKIQNQPLENQVEVIDGQNIDEITAQFWIIQKTERYISQVQEHSLNIINQQVKKLKGQPWNQQQIVRILNNNLQMIRKNWRIQDFPESQEASLEIFYAVFLSIYQDEAIQNFPILGLYSVTLPLITVQNVKQHIKDTPPSERKVQRLIKKILNMKNWTKIKVQEEMTYNEFIDSVKEFKTQCGRSTRNKLQRILLELDKIVAQFDPVWQVQFKIKNYNYETNTSYKENCNNVPDALIELLRLGLNRLPTDIQIANMSTYRNYRLHFAYNFLKSKQQSTKAFNQYQIYLVKVSNINNKMTGLCHLVQQLKSFLLFKSDWQNNVAKIWTNIKSDIFELKKQLKEENLNFKVLTPGPLMWDLALDLYPQAFPFSKTYGRFMGWTVDYKNSLEWYISNSNETEKKYFRWLIKNINYGPLTQLQTQFPNFIQQAYQVKDMVLIEFIDKNLSQMQQLSQEVEEFVKDKINKLPDFLIKQHSKSQEIKWVSTLGLHFYCLEKVYCVEELYLKGYNVDLSDIEVYEVTKKI